MISDRRLQQIGFSARTSRLYGPAIRGLLIVGAIGFGLFQIVTYARVAQATVTVRELADFEVFYRSSQRAAQEVGDPYAVAPKVANGITWTANLNPPHVVLALVALTWFTRETASRSGSSSASHQRFGRSRLFSASSSYASLSRPCP